MSEFTSTTDTGWRSKCCLAAIRMGSKKLKKSNQKIQVWVCCVCGTKDIFLVSREEAKQIREKDQLKPDIDDDGGFTG